MQSLELQLSLSTLLNLGSLKKPHAVCKNAHDNLTQIYASPHKPAFRL